MSRFTFELANQTDDLALQHLMEETPIEGDVKVIFQRKPSYFMATKIEGKVNQTLVCRDNQKNAIVAVGSRSVKPMYINGQIVNVGYLSRLRILSEYRNTTLLARGYRYLKELHQDKRTPFYITTIIEDNAYSLNMLTKRRAGLPFYLEWGLYYTALIKPIRKKEDIKDGFSVIRGSLSYLDEIIEFLNRHGSKKQFFPYYSKEDLNANNEALKDLEIGDFYIAIKGGKIVGILATWDQNKFKQTVIAGYKGKTRLLKPLYNMYAKIGGWPQFPPSGTFLNVIYISFIAIEENNQDVFRVLLREAYNNNVGDRNAYILVGLHSRDPLWKVVQEYAHLEYKGRLFIVCWEDGQEVYKSLDGRIPYLELATL